MSELIVNTTIAVTCVFKNGKLFPAYIHWNNQSIRMERLDMINRLLRGTELIYILSASNSNASYQLRYETKSLNWFLEKIWYKE